MPIRHYTQAESQRVNQWLKTHSNDFHIRDMHPIDAPEQIAAGSTLRMDCDDPFAMSSTYQREN